MVIISERTDTIDEERHVKYSAETIWYVAVECADSAVPVLID